jgi:hypothetical protein
VAKRFPTEPIIPIFHLSISQPFGKLRACPELVEGMNSAKNLDAGRIKMLRDSSSPAASQNDIFGYFFSSLLLAFIHLNPMVFLLSGAKQ